MDQLDSGGRLETKAFEIRRTIAADETVEGFVDRLDIASFQQRLGHVRPTDAALTRDFEDALEANWHTQPLERLDHLLGALQPRVAKPLQRVLERVIVVVQEQTENVNGGAWQVRAQLDGGNHA